MDRSEDRFDSLIEKYAHVYFPDLMGSKASGPIGDRALPYLFKAQIWAESSFDPCAESPAGARGLMQLMPGTARELGLDTHEICDPEKNISAGIRYDRIQYDRLPEIPESIERLKFMLASYNCGRGYVNMALRLAREEEFGFRPLATIGGRWQTWDFTRRHFLSPLCFIESGGVKRRPDADQVLAYVGKVWKKYQQYVAGRMLMKKDGNNARTE